MYRKQKLSNRTVPDDTINMRHLIYELVRPGSKEHKTGRVYDIAISIVVFISLFPLMFKTNGPWEKTIDILTADIILFDYLLRWMTADIRRGEEGKLKPFILYFIHPLALVTFISLLPSFGILSETWRLLRILRLLTLFGYSKHSEKIVAVYRKQKDKLGIVLLITVMFIFATALLVFVSEPDTFEDFFDAVYWATTALTTVGYGDITPVSALGRIISMIASLFGIAIISLPAGIIASGFMEELKEEKENAAAPAEIISADQQAGASADSKVETAGRPQTPVIRDYFMTDSQKKAAPRYLLIMGTSILVNCGLLYMCQIFRLPMWLDTAGTIFASVMLEPCAGIIVGFFTNCLETYSSFEGAILYFMTSSVAALIPGIMLRTRHGDIKKKMFLPTMVLTTVTVSLAATLQALLITGGGLTNVWEVYLQQILVDIGANIFNTVFFPTLMIKIIDMTIIFLVIRLITKSKSLMNLIRGIEDE